MDILQILREAKKDPNETDTKPTNDKDESVDANETKSDDSDLEQENDENLPDADENNDETDESINGSTEQTEEDTIPDVKQNSVLVKNCIELYHIMKNINAKIDTLKDSNPMVIKISIQVKSNIADLQNYLYDFIIGPFKSNPYTKNLYIYNYIIESLNINIEMLNNIKHFSDGK